MEWKKRFSSTPYLVLFVVLIAIGIGTASALITITLSGDVVITGILDMTGDKITNVGNPTQPSDAATKTYVDSAPGTDTLASLGCSENQFPRFDGVNWTCKSIQLVSNLVTLVDGADDVGKFNSIAIGTDGNPVISYFDDTNDDLKVQKCGNLSCTSGNIETTVDGSGDVGRYTSIAIGTDGNPVISYRDTTLDSLRVAKCGNQSCSSGHSETEVDSSGSVGSFTSIAISIDGNPVISYLDITNENLKVAKCGNQSCSSANTITTVDSSGTVGEFTSIAIGIDGNPVISYFDGTNDDLKVAKCGNQSCSSNTITTVDSAGFVGIYSSIAIGTDGNPVISYFDATNVDLKVAKCGNQSCSSANTITTVDSSGSVGSFTSIAIGTDGNPVISYFDATNVELRVAKCGNQSCSSSNIITTVDSSLDEGLNASIAIGIDGNPVISYYDDTNGDLKVAVIGTVMIFS